MRLLYQYPAGLDGLIGLLRETMARIDIKFFKTLPEFLNQVKRPLAGSEYMGILAPKDRGEMDLLTGSRPFLARMNLFLIPAAGKVSLVDQARALMPPVAFTHASRAGVIVQLINKIEKTPDCMEGAA